MDGNDFKRLMGYINTGITQPIKGDIANTGQQLRQMLGGVGNMINQKYQAAPISSLVQGDLRGVGDKINANPQMQALAHPREAMKTPEGLQQLSNFGTMMSGTDMSGPSNPLASQTEYLSPQAVTNAPTPSYTPPESLPGENPFNSGLIGEHVHPSTVLANPLVHPMEGVYNTPLNINQESLIESAGGWKPGMRQQFDMAMFNKDAPGVQRMLQDVPAEYRQRFATEIGNILKPLLGK